MALADLRGRRFTHEWAQVWSDGENAAGQR